MKNVKRLMAALLAVTMICALSVTSFAAINTTAGYYTFDFKFVDSNGNEITNLTAGSTATMEVYLYETSSKNGLSLEIGSEDSFLYALTIDEKLVADTNVTTSKGTASFSKPLPFLTTYTLKNVLSGTISTTKPIATHTFNIGSTEGSYTIAWSGSGQGLTDDTLTAPSFTYAASSKTVNVVAAAAGNKVDDLDDAAAEVKEAFAGKYYIVGDKIENASVEKYVTATDGTTTISTQRKIGEMINASGAVSVTVVPVIIVSQADAAKSFTFGLADAAISK